MINTSIPYGINETGKEVYIDEVPNGKDCKCICPECHKPLIAKNGGEIKIHHFAHSNKTDGATCFQTLLHRYAKDIFKEIYEYTIPEKNKTFKIKEVNLEKRIQDIIPDIVLDTDQSPVFIEIYVTHALDTEKKNKIIDLNIPTVEYDLSKIERNITKEELKNLLFTNPKIRWSYIQEEKRFYLKQRLIFQYGDLIKLDKNGFVPCPGAVKQVFDPYLKRITKSYQYTIQPKFCENCVFCSGRNDKKEMYCGGKLGTIEGFDFFTIIPKWYIMSEKELLEYKITMKEKLWKAVDHAENVLWNRQWRKKYK